MVGGHDVARLNVGEDGAAWIQAVLRFKLLLYALAQEGLNKRTGIQTVSSSPDNPWTCLGHGRQGPALLGGHKRFPSLSTRPDDSAPLPSVPLGPCSSSIVLSPAYSPLAWPLPSDSSPSFAASVQLDRLKEEGRCSAFITHLASCLGWSN